MSKCKYCGGSESVNRQNVCVDCAATWKGAELLWYQFSAAMAGMSATMQQDFTRVTQANTERIRFRDIPQC